MMGQRTYRGTKPFYEMLTDCIITARDRDILYSKNLAERMPDIPIRGNKMANETGSMSGDISRAMDENGHPMLSALIVRTSDEKPGDGFYRLAYRLGKLETDPDHLTESEKETFWQDELERVYDYWA